MLTPYDPAYPVGPGGLTPGYTGPGSLSAASLGASPGALQNPAAFGGAGMPPVAHPFAAGAGGIMPGTSGSMGLIPPMPQMAMPGLSPYGPAIPGTQSFMPAPLGGQWNQLAQQMAGPMFMPPPPSAGIPTPKPVMPTGNPIATVAPPPTPPTPPIPLPVMPPTHQPFTGGGGAFGGGMGGNIGGNLMLRNLRQF